MSLSDKIAAVVAAIGAELKLKADTASLGSAAAQDVTAFASAAQGTRADTAVQPGDLATALSAKQDALGFTPEDVSKKGTAGGYASLDSGGKIPATQLPSSVMELKGTWNATTNSPTLTDGVGDNGDVYRVTVGGTIDLGSGDQTFRPGDWVMYSGGRWEWSPGSDGVSTVAGRTGDIVLTKDDVGLGNVDNTADANKSVASAGKLSNPVSMQVSLTKFAATSFDGSESGTVSPGVSGILDVAHGGTGASTAAAARAALGAGTSNLALGTSAGTAAAGNDARLSDQRTPTDGSVTNAKVAADAAIALSKLATGNVVGSKSGTAADLTVWVGPQASVPTSRDANTVYLWY